MTGEIRPAEPGDVDGIQRVAEAAWRAAHEPIVGSDVVDSFLEEYYGTEQFLERVARDDVVLAVAVEPAGDEAVVGYVLGMPDDDAVLHLSHIYVVPDRWGEGIGRRLLAHVEERARERGADRVELGVMADNDRAVAFYEDGGYSRSGSFYDERADTRSYTYEKPVR